MTLASFLRSLGIFGLFVIAVLDGSPLPTFGGPDILTAILAARHAEPWYYYAAIATLGSVIGAYTLSRETGADFSEAEKEFIQDIAPYVFFAFRRYRWLVALDFFGVSRHDELMYGMLTTDDSGRIPA